MPHFLSAALASSGRRGLRIARSGAWLVTDLELALDSRARTRGLLGRETLPDGGGLVIAPSQGVHTFGMVFPIDIVFLSRDGVVLRCKPAVVPRRLAIWLTAFAVLELPAHSIRHADLRRGDRLIAE
jgi:uncharacterized protein